MKTLVLNIDYTPLSIISTRRAVVQSIKNEKMKVLSYYDLSIASERDELLVPAVMLYHSYVKITPKKRPSKRAVFLRDAMICQYCNLDLFKKSATIDHIRPVSSFQSKSQANTWCNMVACCKACNIKKGDRPLHETGMRLKRKPGLPKRTNIITYAPEEWKAFL